MAISSLATDALDRKLAAVEAHHLARLIREHQLSVSEICDYYLSRIARFNRDYEALVRVTDVAARRQAARLDAEPARSPLFGVPVVVKDMNAVRGTFMRMGSASMQHLYTPVDDPLVARLRRAGMVVLGKTAMSELGVLPVTEPRTHPPTRNPHDPSVTPGGSSGGAGAALAADLAPLALGSDGGGSVRIPAAFCGLVGFKPSRGLVTNPFAKDSPRLLWTCGPIARSVLDAALLLDVLVEPGGNLGSRAFAAFQRYRAGWSPDSASPSFSAAVGHVGRRLRIRFTTRSTLVNAEPEVAAAVERAASLLERAGHRVEEGETARGTTRDEFLPLWQAAIADAPVRRWDRTEPVTQWLGKPGRLLQPRDVASLTARITANVLDWFGDVDAWLVPTVAVAPPRIGAWKGLGPRETYEAAAEIAAFTAPVNVTGQPAVSVPAGVSSRRHPIGVQLVGRARADAELLTLAAELESLLAL